MDLHRSHTDRQERWNWHVRNFESPSSFLELMTGYCPIILEFLVLQTLQVYCNCILVISGFSSDIAGYGKLEQILKYLTYMFLTRYWFISHFSLEVFKKNGVLATKLEFELCNAALHSCLRISFFITSFLSVTKAWCNIKRLK